MYSPAVVRVVEQAENALRDFFIARGIFTTKGTLNAAIESWHDAPDVSGRWIGDDGIERNIHLCVYDEGKPSEHIILEINAWKDDRENLKRRWINVQVLKISLTAEAAAKTQYFVGLYIFALGVAYDVVCALTLEQLVNEGYIKPLPRA